MLLLVAFFLLPSLSALVWEPIRGLLELFQSVASI
jgi:hypothetical protein